ncbi:MAG: TolC family protein, partial [Spirochaetes bacterium]|nr:TolC family protein [Spirochaetota bacterium]
MKHRTRIVLAVSALLLTAGLAGHAQDNTQEQLELSEEEAVIQALRANLGLAIEGRNVAVKERNRSRVWNQLLPSLQVNGTLSRSNAEQEFSSLVPAGPPRPDGSFDFVQQLEETAPRWSVSTQVSAQLDLSLRLYFAVKQTAVDLREGRIGLADAEDQVRRDVRKQYRQVALLEESVRVTEAKLATARAQVESAEVNVDNGLADRSSLLQAQIGAANTEVALAEQRNAVASARRALKSTLGIPMETDVVLTNGDAPMFRDDLPRFDRGEVLDLALANRRELQSLQVQVDRLQTLQRLERAGLFPSVRLSWSADPAFQGDPLEDSWFEDIDEQWQQQRGGFSLTVVQPLDPLLPGSSTWTTIANYDDQILQLRLQREQLRQGARMEVASLLDSLASLGATIRARELNVALAGRNLDLA